MVRTVRRGFWSVRNQGHNWETRPVLVEVGLWGEVLSLLTSQAALSMGCGAGPGGLPRPLWPWPGP